MFLCPRLPAYEGGTKRIRLGIKLWRDCSNLEGWMYYKSGLSSKITEAYEKNPDLSNLLLDDYFRDCLENSQSSWRKIVCLASTHGIPIPTFASALSYFDGYRSADYPKICYKLRETILVPIL